jgi:hypothetical protein
MSQIAFEAQAKLIEVVQKPYKVEGNEGISYKLRFLVGDDIFELKSSLEQTEELKASQGFTGLAKFIVKARKETVTIVLASFTKTK